MFPLDFFVFKENELYGSSLPHTKEHLTKISNAGIRIVISLTEDIQLYENQPLFREFFKHFTILIPDFGVPNYQQVVDFLKIMREAKKKKEPVLVHCLAGCGRTGMMLALAAKFIYNVEDGQEAIDLVRAVRPCAIENKDQEDFVKNFNLI